MNANLRKTVKHIEGFWEDNKQIYTSFVLNDLKFRYNGSNLGLVWGIIQPLITVLIYWFVFQVGLRSGARPDGTPYILWLICGMVPWFFFSEVFGVLGNTFLDYAYLVKKIHFHIGLLLFVKITSSLIIHLIFLLITTIILNFYGFVADFYYLQLFYYTFALCFFSLGIGLIVAPISVFFRDMNQIIGILNQIGFWIIPIVWGKEVLSPRLQIVFELNPIYYIVEGYRETLLSRIPFWSHPILTAYFWCFSIVVFLIGLRTFRKLKPYFVDVM